MIIALAGGVGGAKLAHGLAGVLAPGELIVVVNTADDFEHLGLHISPDPDTVMYTLAGLADRERGWGLADESWKFMAALERLGGPGWFALGDKDLATHIERTRLLKDGETLSQVTQLFCSRLGISNTILPMSDRAVRTILHTDKGNLTFQDYFVRQRCEPRVGSISYEGASSAEPSRQVLEAMHDPELRGIVICPSNPYLSIAPILALAGVREWLKDRNVPAVAVSPIIGGRAVKGPAAKIFGELGLPATSQSVADHYADLIDGLVIDHADDGAVSPKRGLSLHTTDALMHDEQDRKRLAREVVDFLDRLREVM